MIHFALKYLYILFIFVFVFLLMFFSGTNDVIQNYIIFSYLILLLPIFDFWFEYFKSEIIPTPQYQKWIVIWDICIQYMKKLWMFLWKYVHIVLIIFVCYVSYRLFWDNIFQFLLILFLLFWIYFKIDSRFAFVIALLLLLWIPLFLILNQNALSETFSIYLYYLLIIWVILSLNESTENKISQYAVRLWKKIKYFLESWGKYFLRYPDDVMYDVLFLWTLSFIGSLYFEGFHNLLTPMILFIFLVYLAAKIVGFRFELDKEIIPFFQKQNIEPFILFFSLSVIIFSSLGNMLLVENRILIFFSFTFINFLVFAFLFTDLKNLLKRIILRHTYIFSMCILGIVAVLFYSFGSKIFEKNDEILPQESDIVSSVDVFNPALPDDLPVVPPVTPIKFNISQFQENLWFGSTWEKVATLQAFLNDAGYYNFSFNGMYDENTRAAMRRFLSAECLFSQNNQWILWNQERICIQDFLEK